jgi:hypothetical protein
MRHVLPKCRLTFNGLHGVISQQIEFFITTAVRASDPIFPGSFTSSWPLCVTVFSAYLHSFEFFKAVLVVSILWYCPAFWWRDMNIRILSFLCVYFWTTCYICRGNIIFDPAWDKRTSHCERSGCHYKRMTYKWPYFAILDCLCRRGDMKYFALSYGIFVSWWLFPLIPPLFSLLLLHDGTTLRRPSFLLQISSCVLWLFEYNTKRKWPL